MASWLQLLLLLLLLPPLLLLLLPLRPILLLLLMSQLMSLQLPPPSLLLLLLIDERLSRLPGQLVAAEASDGSRQTVDVLVAAEMCICVFEVEKPSARHMVSMAKW